MFSHFLDGSWCTLGTLYTLLDVESLINANARMCGTTVHTHAVTMAHSHVSYSQLSIHTSILVVVDNG